MTIFETLNKLLREAAVSLGVFLRDVGHGLLEIGHNGLAVLGLGVVAGVIFAAGNTDVRQYVEGVALDWLQTRQDDRATASGDLLVAAADQDGVSRATAVDPSKLNPQQAHVAQWITRRYKVAPEPISRLVQEAWAMGKRAGLDPTLILAVMAVESSFNPFAQSPVGAQGLMQVMTRVHDSKYEAFGGTHAAFDPVSNLRVGVQVLKECITRAGNLNDGLRNYVGASAAEGDSVYVNRVLAEQAQMRSAADGKPAPANTNPSQRRDAPLAKPEPPSLPHDVAQVALLR